MARSQTRSQFMQHSRSHRAAIAVRRSAIISATVLLGSLLPIQPLHPGGAVAQEARTSSASTSESFDPSHRQGLWLGAGLGAGFDRAAQTKVSRPTRLDASVTDLTEDTVEARTQSGPQPEALTVARVERFGSGRGRSPRLLRHGSTEAASSSLARFSSPGVPMCRMWASSRKCPRKLRRASWKLFVVSTSAPARM